MYSFGTTSDLCRGLLISLNVGSAAHMAQCIDSVVHDNNMHILHRVPDWIFA